MFRVVNGAWKLGDFGSSLRIGDERVMNRQVLKLEGTFSFAAPEYISIWDSFTKPQLVAATTFKVQSICGCMCGCGGVCDGGAHRLLNA